MADKTETTGGVSKGMDELAAANLANQQAADAANMDETVPGGRYRIFDGKDDKGKDQFREVNAFGEEFKEGTTEADLAEIQRKQERGI